jgi:hypothetical protein
MQEECLHVICLQVALVVVVAIYVINKQELMQV